MTATITYLSTSTVSSQSDSYTFSSVSLGSASADRVIGVVVTGEPLDAPADVNAVSVGGVSATKIVQIIEPNEGYTSSLWVAEVPTGTTGDVVVTLNVDYLQCFCHLWVMTGVDASSAYATVTDADDIVNLDCNIPEGGVVFGAAQFASTNAVTTTGMTENYDASFDGDRGVSGSAGPLSAETPRTISFNGGTGTAAGVAASFSPSSSGATLTVSSLLADGDVFQSPAIALVVAASTVTGAPAFHGPISRLAVGPDGTSAAGSIHPPALEFGDTLTPVHLNSTTTTYVPIVRSAISAVALIDSDVAHGPTLRVGLPAAAFANVEAIHVSAVRFALGPPTLATAQVFPAAGIDLPGAKLCPAVPSSAIVFLPALVEATAYEVVGTLGVAGWTPQRQRRADPVLRWPNLPKVEAPSWRLTVVTPEVARQRAREQMAWRKRSQRLRRKREAEREVIDLEVARTIARLIAEGT